MLVITWGGLRGAVGLALALVVEQTAGVPQETIGNRVSHAGDYVHGGCMGIGLALADGRSALVYLLILS